MDLRWNCRHGGHQSEQRDFVFRLCIPGFGGEVGEDSLKFLPRSAEGKRPCGAVVWGLEMPTEDACHLGGSAPWGSLTKELEANVPSSYSGKAKL